MNTKQLFKIDQNDIEKICDVSCETDQCPFKKSLRECREDGFCIKQTYHNIDIWIKEDEDDIQDLENKIKIIKERIAKYKRWKKKINNELKKEELYNGTHNNR